MYVAGSAHRLGRGGCPASGWLVLVPRLLAPPFERMEAEGEGWALAEAPSSQVSGPEGQVGSAGREAEAPRMGLTPGCCWDRSMTPQLPHEKPPLPP